MSEYDAWLLYIYKYSEVTKHHKEIWKRCPLLQKNKKKKKKKQRERKKEKEKRNLCVVLDACF